MLAYDDELRSPVSGQVAFVQDLVRELAYRTLSRSERQAAHLAAAAHYAAVGDEDLVEATAAHLAAAYAADPSHPDAASIAARASALLRQAARRALSLHAPERALDDLERALAMPDDDDADRDELLEETASAARRAGRLAVAEGHLRELVARSAGGPAAVRDRYRAKLASVLLMAHQNAAALTELEAAIDAGSDDASPAVAELIGQLARANLLVGRDSDAVRWGTRALDARAAQRDRCHRGRRARHRGDGRFRAGDEQAASPTCAPPSTRRVPRDCRRRSSARATTSPGSRWWTIRAAPSRSHARAGSWHADRHARLGGADGGAGLPRRDRDRRLGLGAGTQARFEERPISAAYRIDLAGSIATIQLLRGAPPHPLAAIEALGPLDPATDPRTPPRSTMPEPGRSCSRAISRRRRAGGTVGRVALGAERFRALVLGPARGRGRAPPTSCAWRSTTSMPFTSPAARRPRRGRPSPPAWPRSTAPGCAGRNTRGGRDVARARAAAHLALCLLEWRRLADGDTLDELRGVIEGSGRAASCHSSTRWR